MVTDRTSDGTGLVDVAGVAGDRRDRSVGTVGAQRPAVTLAEPEHGVSHREDLRRGAVVVVEADDLGPREAAVEAGEERRVGPVPRIDGLVRIANDTEVDRLGGGRVTLDPEPALEQAVLRRVDVLELVDEQVAEAPPLASGEGLVGLERLDAAHEQVVEVDHAAAVLLILVAGVHLGHRLDTEWRLALKPGHFGHVGRRHDEPGLRPFDLAHHIDRLHAA